MLLCQLVKVQVVQEAALQDVTRCRTYLPSYCNISLAGVNELDTGCPRPARQTELLCAPPSFVSACRQAAASENSQSTTRAGGAGASAAQQGRLSLGASSASTARLSAEAIGSRL